MPAAALKLLDEPTPYDVVPYPSDAFPQTDPRRISCIARMFGLAAVDPRKARVLELGCASGGNLLPLAGRLPLAKFVGVDFSTKQIAEARRLAGEYGLTNLRLEHMSLADIDASFGQFDYIICHGVYSWVSAEVQVAILRVCEERLSREGVAFVSYNTYPGWKPREILRDAMLFHTRNIPYGPQKSPMRGACSNSCARPAQRARRFARSLTSKAPCWSMPPTITCCMIFWRRKTAPATSMNSTNGSTQRA